MFGKGILRGLGVTLKHFFNTYVDDIRYGMKKYSNPDNFESRQSPRAEGAFTVQYPDEKMAVPERFRFVPFLVINDQDSEIEPGRDWCTSCGICAKVCPPQCIWIVRGTNPDTGRPVPEPEAFFIDIDICMNCGFCAEFCPFDAIKMDHDYEMASFDRTLTHIHDKEKLSKEFSYWRKIAPTTAYEEMQARGGWEHTDVVKARKKGKAPVKPQAPANGATAEAAPAAEAVAEAPAESQVDERAEKIKARREAALARRRARTAD
jgi:NADH-quinone oxidoreductase subunit I